MDMVHCFIDSKTLGHAEEEQVMHTNALTSNQQRIASCTNQTDCAALLQTVGVICVLTSSF